MYQPALSNPSREHFSLAPLREALTARYRCADFDCVVRPGHRVDAICGEYVQLELDVTHTARKLSMLRAPAGDEHNASFELTGNRVICHRPGLYIVALDLLDCGFRRELEVVAWPKAALGGVGLAPEMPTARRGRLRSITRDPSATRESIIAALEQPIATIKHPVFGDVFPTATFAVFVGRTPEAGISLAAYGYTQ